MAIYMGLGTNLGNLLANLNAAMEHFSILQQSSLYETEPVDFHEQPWFLNAVIRINTTLSPQELLELSQKIENSMGRTRIVSKGPRVIDIDILFYDDLVISSQELIVPHSQIQHRRFVLEPMNEIAPHFVHPVLKKTIRELLIATSDTSVVRKL